MARGGINKALVQKAKTSLLAQGKHPSIDAVRVALGNTGSKTTISRYLKELESLPLTPGLSSSDRLSAPLLEIVAELATVLDQEAQMTVEAARRQFADESRYLETVLETVRRELEERDKTLESLRALVQTLEQRLLTVDAHLVQERQHSMQLQTDVQTQKVQLEEKQLQIISLDESQTHARSALERYREAGLTQREQLIQQYETQQQHLQRQITLLNEVAATRQDELIRLNRDNERLVQQVSILLKQEQLSEQHVRDLREQQTSQENSRQKLLDSETRARERLSKAHLSLNHLKSRLEIIVQEKQSLQATLLQLNLLRDS
jgi:chromosome segregation ATPase